MNTTRSRGHTPRPWKATAIAQGTGDYCIHAKGIPWQLAYFSESSQIDWPIEANARMAAAAPDMFEALKETLAIATRNEDGPWADRARAALRKASEG